MNLDDLFACRSSCCCKKDDEFEVTSTMPMGSFTAVGMKTGDLVLPEPNNPLMVRSQEEKEPPEPSKIPEPSPGKELAEPSTMPSNEIVVELAKSNESSRIGMDVDHGDNVSLVVVEVMEGLVKDYNSTVAEELQIRPGDQIMEVNGVSGDSIKMLETAGLALQLRFRVRHNS
mmetsp:Transcript_116480/g.206208  ORF Transcript_116480/g.206208 Transcript_116480/m.206208 type:complete len:173 (-) Transcript_116480:164-682(-)